MRYRLGGFAAVCALAQTGLQPADQVLVDGDAPGRRHGEPQLAHRRELAAANARRLVSALLSPVMPVGCQRPRDKHDLLRQPVEHRQGELVGAV